MAVARHYANVVKLLYAQALLGFVVSVPLGVCFGWKMAVSSALGALIAILSNAYFAFKFLFTSGWDAQAIVRAFYFGEAVKMAMTAALFYLALQIPSVDFFALLAGFAAGLSVFWFAFKYWRG
jgi:ATP synthase protein I